MMFISLVAVILAVAIDPAWGQPVTLPPPTLPPSVIPPTAEPTTSPPDTPLVTPSPLPPDPPKTTPKPNTFAPPSEPLTSPPINSTPTPPVPPGSTARTSTPPAPTPPNNDGGETTTPTETTSSPATTQSSSSSTNAPTGSPTPTSSNTTNTNPTPTPSESESSATSATTIGLAVSGGVAVAFAGYVLIRRRSRKSLGTTTGGSSTDQLVNEDHQLIWKELELYKIGLEEIQMTRSIAAGAFGEVWLGVFRGETVAIKTCLSTKSSRKNLQSFIDELALMGSFSCPYIVSMLGAAWTRPTDLKAVLEYMNMRDLRDYLSTSSPTTFPWKNKIGCALHVAKALAYLKSIQVIHRDLKSRNVLLDGNKGTMLADFGISREDSENTMTAGVGTYCWMAPEVLTFKYYTIAVDIFSFGVLLSELSTHEIPYKDLRNEQGNPVSDTAIVGMVLYKNLRPDFSNDTPQWIHDLAMQCMSTVAEERPAPSEVVDILQSHVQNDF